jgi:DNA-binding CsgD family transcriptional regulator
MSELAHQLRDLGNADITAALRELPLHAFLVDSNGIIRWQSKASRTGLGRLAGHRWFDELPSTFPLSEANQDLWARTLSSGEPVEFTIEVREADGQVNRHEINAAPLHDGGSLVGFFGVAVPSGPSARHPHVLSGDLLTKRQLEVLELLAEGMSTSQIAAQLYISKTTVRNHIAHLLSNLGAHTRLEAIVLARKAGLIRMD